MIARRIANILALTGGTIAVTVFLFIPEYALVWSISGFIAVVCLIVSYGLQPCNTYSESQQQSELHTGGD